MLLIFQHMYIYFIIILLCGARARCKQFSKESQIVRHNEFIFFFLLQKAPPRVFIYLDFCHLKKYIIHREDVRL